MKTLLVKKHNSLFNRTISLIVVLAFFATAIITPSYAQSIVTLRLPDAGEMITQSPPFVPVLLKGMRIHQDDPFKLDFIVDSGNTDFRQDKIRKESDKLVKYFLASITIPKNDLWVNLSPYEEGRIIPDELGRTALGRDMLAQDYLLKQLTASLIYPEDKLGKEFWKRVYEKAQEQFGTTEVPINTFNKVWIIPESATVYENGQTVYVVESQLKVLLDEDYVAISADNVNAESLVLASEGENSATFSSQIVREIILPEIEKEVNSGKNFAPLRQIYHALILSKWYKEKIKESLLSKVYIDQKKILGIEIDDKTIREQIYAKYMLAYEKGVFDFIKEDYDQLSQELIPRKYFSGGEKFREIPLKIINESVDFDGAMTGDTNQLTVRIVPRAYSLEDAMPFSLQRLREIPFPEEENARILKEIIEKQKNTLISLLTGPNSYSSKKEEYRPIMRHQFYSELVDAGLVPDAATREEEVVVALDQLFHIIYLVFRNPFMLNEEIMDSISIDADRLKQLNHLVQQNALSQDIFHNHSFYRGYVRTIDRFFRDNTIPDTLQHEFHFPTNINIYVGPRCPFKCYFCSRLSSKHPYQRADLMPEEFYVNFIDSIPDPEETVLYFSGGLEPLTFSNLGNLIVRSKKRGMKSVNLYTNGYLFNTPKVKRSISQILQADVIRFSFHTVREDRYKDAVGLNYEAFQQVLVNLNDLIARRNRSGSNAKIGVSFVLSKVNVGELNDLIQMISDINKKHDGRGVDFLSLRSDFRELEDYQLTDEETEVLRNDLSNIEERRASGEFGNLNIDYGDTIWQVLLGRKNFSQLEFSEEKIFKNGFPNISITISPIGEVFLFPDPIVPGMQEVTDTMKIGQVDDGGSVPQLLRDTLNTAYDFSDELDKHVDVFTRILSLFFWSTERNQEQGFSLNDSPVRYSNVPLDSKNRISAILNEDTTTDRAQLSEVGGVDMNDIEIKKQGSGVDVQFDPAMLQNIIHQGVDGFVPVIIKLTPLNSIMPFLGLEPKNREKYEFLSLN